jgi:hypothetical protein
MKLAKRIFTASIAITMVLCSSAVFAQMEELRNTTPVQRAKLQTAFMKKRLDLSKQQIPQVMNINLKYAKQMDPLIKGNEGKLKKTRQIMALGQAKDNELTKVLSPGQYEAYLASKEQMRQAMIDKIKQKQAGAG